MSTSNTDLGQAPIGRLLLQMAAPAIVAQLINVLYNIVDRMYIGHIDVIGPTALTGVGVTMPIVTLISAFSYLIGMGGAPKAAIAMGQKDLKRAEEILGGFIGNAALCRGIPVYLCLGHHLCAAGAGPKPLYFQPRLCLDQYENHAHWRNFKHYPRPHFYVCF